MKRFAYIFVAIASSYSFGCYAQNNELKHVNAKIQGAKMVEGNDLAVVSYHVEERINMRFGSNITTYDVSNLSLINTNDLGENNVRIITPKYAKVKAVAIKLDLELPKINSTSPTAIVASESHIKIDVYLPKRRKDFANIDIVDTYERVLDKGFKSVDMIKKVADSHFFDDNMQSACKWYGELFALTTDLDTIYYFRYAQTLKATGQIQKAEEMMKIFENKNL